MTTHEQRQRRRKTTKAAEVFWKYSDTILLPPVGATVDGDGVNRDIEDVLDKVREVEDATLQHAITFTVEGEDLWALRETLDELETELDSRGLDWTPDRSKVIGPVLR